MYERYGKGHGEPRWYTHVVLGALVLLVGACDNLTGPRSDEAPNFSVAFGVVSGGGSASIGPASASVSPVAPSWSEGSLSVVASNGTLVVDDVRFIVAAFQLRPTAETCGFDGSEGVSCHHFESPPRFLQLPLGGDTELALAEDVPPGSYRGLRFRVENLDLGEVAAGVTAQDLAGLFTDISSEFPEWPAGASMLVSGAFTPTGTAAPIPFDVYFDAEIEVVRVFDPPLVIGSGDLTVTLDLDLSRWFLNESGIVRNLAELDYTVTGDLVEFRAEFERGFRDHRVDDGRHEEAESVRFSGPVTSVDAANGTLVVDGELVVRVGEDTEIVTGEPGLLGTLAEAAEALEEGLLVRVIGRGAVVDEEPRTILAREMALSVERAEFEGRVESVDLEAGRFTLVREEMETVVLVTEETDFRGGDGFGRLTSLAAVAEALSGGELVRAHGWGVVESVEPRTIRAAVVTFPRVGEDFESGVEAVDLEAGALTLESGVVVRVAEGTEVRSSDEPNHLAGLAAVASVLEEGGQVVACGEGFVVGVAPLEINAVWVSLAEVIDDP